MPIDEGKFILISFSYGNIPDVMFGVFIKTLFVVVFATSIVSFVICPKFIVFKFELLPNDFAPILVNFGIGPVKFTISILLKLNADAPIVVSCVEPDMSNSVILFFSNALSPIDVISLGNVIFPFKLQS